MIHIYMWLVKTKKKIKVVEFKTVADLETWALSIDKHLMKFTNDMIEKAQLLLSSTTDINAKQLKRWYSTSLNGGCSQFSSKFWTTRGYSQDEAQAQVFVRQSRNGQQKAQKIMKMKASNDCSWKDGFNTTLEYYLKNGMSLDEAKIALSERQATFSLQTCIHRYGQDEGIMIWQARQEKWQNTLASKTDAEKLDILRRKVVPIGRASRESLAIFVPLHKFIVEHGIVDDSEVYYGYGKRNEWYLADTQHFYLYDFCIPKLKLIIEYNGKVWHPDYRLTLEQLTSWRNPHGVDAMTMQRADREKREFAKQHGFTVIDLWGADSLEENMDVAFEALKVVVEQRPIVVPISTIDQLMTHSEVLIDSPVGFQRVTEFFIKHDKQLYDLILEGGVHIKASGDHYFRFETGQWVSVDDLYAARDVMWRSRLQTDCGFRYIISINEAEMGMVNDITVEHPEHAYYANGIVSHNTGKTLIALAAGLEQLETFGNKSHYKKVIVTRPVQPVGKDIGFLPGTLEEKMEPWIAPIRDNLNFLMNKGTKKKTAKAPEPYISIMQQRGLIEIEAISYIRGRSIPDSFIVIDEAQNLSIHELKTIITRVGDGTKIVLTGDIEQIDNVHVDTYTNGLTYAVEKFKEHEIAGHISLIKGERSELASLASKIL